MQVTELKNEGLNREYKIVVDAKAINDRIDAQLKSMASRIKIPGFRPGHVPMNILQQRYGESVTGEVVERQVNQSAQQVMKDKSLRAALPAKVDVTSYKEGGDLEFTMKIEVLPDVPVIDYKKVTLEKPVFEVDEKEINEGLTRLAERNKELKKLGASAKAKKGDVVTIDFIGRINGEAFEGGSAKDVKLELGAGQFIPGFEDQLIGSKAGDTVTVKVSFPKDYHSAELAGKPAEFEVKVHEVSETTVPEVNDAFAATMGFESVEKMKELLRSQFQADYDRVGRSRIKKQLFDHLEENCVFDVPQGMVDMEFQSIWERLQEAKKNGDEDLVGKTDDELKKEYTKIAERRVRLGLILSDVGHKNKITVTKDELSKALMEQARMFPGQEKKNPGQLEDLRGPILEEKAVDFIVSQASVKDKKLSISELTSEEEGDSKKKSSAKDKAEGGEKKTAKKKAANE